MKAWLVRELGEPLDVMRLEDIPVPQPEAGQVLVRVLAAAANFPDALMCRGTYQVKPPLPFTPGLEVCGEVVQVGPGIPHVAMGDRVIGSPVPPSGAYSEFTVLGNTTCFSAPPELDDAEAAAFSISYQTGWFGLHRRAQIRPGETLLVHAAAGGVGSAAVQLGKAAGARVIGVAGGAHKVAVVRALGADIVVDRHSEDFVEVVMSATEGRGADVIYDPIGGDTYFRSTKCIAFEGRIVIVGFAGGEIQRAPLNHPLVKNYSVVGLHWGLYWTKDPASLQECHEGLLRLTAQGLVAPLIGARLGMDDIPAGISDLAAGRTVGRLAFVL